MSTKELISDYDCELTTLMDEGLRTVNETVIVNPGNSETWKAMENITNSILGHGSHHQHSSQ